MDLDVSGLRNRFYGFRHGESRANVEGIIISDPAVGTMDYGLSDEGRRQVAASVAKLPAMRDVLIVSSDFLRTVETAQLICDALGTDDRRCDERLRERYFGEWDGACYLHYADAWKQDEIDPDQEIDGAESANMVRSRMVRAVLDLEGEYADRDIILVSHGDPLRLLQSAFEGLDTALNRSIPYFETAGWRLLNSRTGD